MISKLVEHIQKHVKLSEEEIQVLSQCFTVIHVARKQFLLQQGEVCEANFFVLSGCLRLYSINDELKEQTVQFAIEQWWMADYASLENRTISPFFIQATEPTTVAALRREVQEELMERLPQLERYFRIIYQRAFSASIWRIHHIFSKTGEERYHQFVKLFPGFVQRVPQYMLASFLGFTPEFLSMLRAKRSNQRIS